MSSSWITSSRGWHVLRIGVLGLATLTCASPVITGAAVVNRGHRVPQSREIGRYEVAACRDRANRSVASRPMSVRLFASATGYALFVERPEANTLWFERGTAAPGAFHFQAVVRAPGGVPRLWDFRLPTEPIGARGSLLVASHWTEHGDSPHLSDIVVRRCALLPELQPEAGARGVLTER